jgi:outer membrane protein assembly factor BamA
MTAKQGEFFQLDNKSADERFIRDLYGTQGHYFCDVVGEMVYQPNNEVDIIYNVGEGDIYRISDVRVHIEGDFTKERVVLHPLANVRPGSIIDSKGVEDATRRLRFSSIFNNDPSQGIVPTIKVEPPENVDLDK